MSLHSALKARPSATPVTRSALVSKLREASRKAAKPTERRASDLERLLMLPRREPLNLHSDAALELARTMTARYRRPTIAPCDCAARKRPCPSEFLPIQAWTLKEAEECGGVVGSIGVGHGKTLLDFLLPMAIKDCKVAVLLVPPSLRAQLDVQWSLYEAHGWRLPNRAGGRWFDETRPVLHVVAYSQLAHEHGTTVLESLRPDLIIADECHRLKNQDSVQTGRFLRYITANPHCRFAALSGTLTKKSFKDFPHLAILALREGAPVPLQKTVVEEWSLYLDPRTDKDGNDIVKYVPDHHPLVRFCEREDLKPRDDKKNPWGTIFGAPVRAVRQAYHKRLVETPGFIYTPGKSVNIPIIFHTRETQVPPVIDEAFDGLKQKWKRPDGFEIMDALAAAKCARELACGFYYREIFPRGEAKELVDEWKSRRKAYNAELRAKLERRQPYMDSPLHCWNAAQRYYDDYEGALPTWASSTWPAWAAIKPLVEPDTEPVWIDDFLARSAADWAKEAPGIVWYSHVTFGQRIAQLSGLPLYGAGKKAAEGLLQERGDRSIIVSVHAHNEGKELQMFSRQLVANPPSDGGLWEQLLGRTHRTGQNAKAVQVWVYRHVEQMVRAIDKAESLAEYIEDMLNMSQRLLSGHTPGEN